ncbi:MAG: tetratricopeptide repeat protein, partial [Chthoniobacterales bacterium]|nr:tetratricopeptide repeat protein [Chthoniobacterales bacterium]
MKPLPALLLASLFLALQPLTLLAQSQKALEENEAAYALYSAADYKAAAEAYEALIQGYPNDLILQTALIQLGLCRFFLGEFDQALASLDKAKNGQPPLTAQQLQIVENVRPQILAAKAMALPPGDSARKGNFDEAIKAYSDFITKYPQSPELEAAIYGRALCEFQIGQFDKTVTDLQSNLQKFPSSPTIQSSQNLLALAYASQGGEILSKEGGDKAAGLDLLKKAEDILRKIITEKKDLALVNDAHFQLGEILFMSAAFSPEDQRAAIYEEAAQAYMSLIPKAEVVAMQQEKIKGFAAKKADALRARNMTLKAQLDRDNERELKKLAEISAKPDQTAAALLKLGEIFFNAGKHNESRVVISHVTPFLSTDDEKMRAGYFKALGYTVQGAAEPATKAYDAFQSSFKGKPIAENLPFAMGAMFLGRGDNETAIRYFEESLQIYPQGRLAGLTVAQKAQAQVGLRQYEDALKTFEASLANNPSPEVGVVAQFGIANIHRDTAKWDDAIVAYQLVVEKYPSTPQAAESAYWIAACTQQKGDNAAAAPLLEAFIQANSGHPLEPLALFALGNARIANGQKDEGIATLAEVVEKFPDSQPAPFTFFARAQVLAADQNAAGINELMRAFIEKYPKDDKIFFAFNSIAQNQTNAADLPGAVATWQEFTKNYPDHPNTPASIVKTAELQRAQAEKLATNYTSLNEADRATWMEAVNGSIATLEQMLAAYPQSPDVAGGLQALLAAQRLLLGSQQTDETQVESYFQQLADKTSDTGARSKILFTLAGFIAQKDKDRALAKMNEAYNAQVVYSPKDIDIYGLALIDAGKNDEAIAVFEKLAADFPIPAGVEPSAAPPNVQEAQATALFGRGRVAQAKNQTAEAGEFFKQLKSTYPWSPKGLEADYGIAQSLRAENKPDEAMPLLGAIIRAPNATAELRANSFLLYGHIMKDKAAAESDPKKQEENRASAIDFFMKIPQFYSGVPAAAAEGLWEGGQLLEMQAAASQDPAFKTQQLSRARAAYEQLTKEFSNDKFAPQAQQ